MKNAVKLICVFAGLLLSFPVFAKLLGPELEAIGLFDDNPAHIAIVLKDGSAIQSYDCGSIWKAVKKRDLPEKLSPLPTTGKITYHNDEFTILCSEDSGEHWKNVSSPRRLLRCGLEKIVEDERLEYVKEFYWRLPDYESWPIPFAISALLIVIASSIILARRHEPWVSPLLLSCVVYCCIGALFWWGCSFWVNMFSHSQWIGRAEYQSCGPMYPRLILGILLLLCGSPYLTPLAALLCFPFTPLFASKLMTDSTIFRRLRLVWILLALAFFILIPIALSYGRGENY